MSILPINVYGADVLQPYMYPDLARTLAVNLAPGTYVKGQLLGEVVNATAQNEQQTLTPTGTISAGTFTLTLDGLTTAAIVYNATAAAIVSALNALFGYTMVSATGGPIHTTAVVLTFIGDYASRDVPMLVVNSSLTGTDPLITLTETAKGRSASGTYRAYATGNTDGSGVAKAILQYPCTVDGQGNVSGWETGSRKKTAEVYTRGCFRTSDIVGLDADAIADLTARFQSGSLAAGGVIIIP